MVRHSVWDTTVKYLSVMALVALAGCVPPSRAYSRRQRPAPCSELVPPIRNVGILAVINVTYTYTPKDAEGGRSGHRNDILDELNGLGRPDGNTFAEPNGQQPNFHFNYSISNDGQDHFTGSLELAGWGQGHISTFNKYQYPYASSDQLVKDLTDDAYGYVHAGWHDSRPNCPQS